MLEIQNLSVAYGNFLALRQVSLTAREGEVVAVIGPNGAGKSTLIRAVSGVVAPKEGLIRVGGRDAARLSPIERARYMAVVPQARALPPDFSVYQTVLLGRTPHLNWLGSAGESDHARVRRALALTETDHLARRPVGTLSGGEQQRVLLARALAQDTPLLLLDEPTTHLDLRHQSTLLKLVRRLATDQGLAVLMVLHDLNAAALFADRIALLAAGRVFAQGRPAAVLTRQNLSEVFQIPVTILPHPDNGAPLILPDGDGLLPQISPSVQID